MEKRHRNFNFYNETIKELNLDKNEVLTNEGNTFSYEYLILATGTHSNIDSIKGAREALNDPNCPVGCNYKLDHAQKMNSVRKNFNGGKFIFTSPSTPIKCGGAPLKIMFLSADYWNKKSLN